MPALPTTLSFVIAGLSYILFDILLIYQFYDNAVNIKSLLQQKNSVLLDNSLFLLENIK